MKNVCYVKHYSENENIDYEKISANHIDDKIYVSSIYKEILSLNS